MNKKYISKNLLRRPKTAEELGSIKISYSNKLKTQVIILQKIAKPITRFV
jgi:hypothetical protein